MRTIENCNLLFQKNEAGSCFKVSQKYVIHHRGPECNGATMHRLIKEINGCLQKCSDRRLVSSSEESSSPIFCTIMMEIRTFLSLFTDNDKYRKEVAEVVSELAGNAWEHAKSDCMIDIDVQVDFKKPGAPKDESYYGVNIVVINFAHVLLGDELKEKLMTRDDSALDGRCRQVKDAYSYHKNYFSDKYNVDDFFNIASFQDRVSSREDSGESGGPEYRRTVRHPPRPAPPTVQIRLRGRS